MSATFLITTPNPKYGGRTLGVQFSGGKALIDASVIDAAIAKKNPNTRLTDAFVIAFAQRFKDEFNYIVERRDKPAAEPVPEKAVK